MAQRVKNPPAMRETCVGSLGWEDPLGRERLPTPVSWPGEFHGLYSPCGHKKSDTTEQLNYHHLLLIINKSVIKGELIFSRWETDNITYCEWGGSQNLQICGQCKDQSKRDEDRNTEALSELRPVGVENHYSEPMSVNSVVFLAICNHPD